MVSQNLQNIAAQSHSPNRRDVLKGISAAALAGSGLLKAAFGNADPTSIEARAASVALDRSQGLTWLPAWKLREMIVKREVSSVEVVRHFLNRIEEHDPTLKAFRKLDAQAALAAAEQADKAVKAGEMLGPLHGVPIAVKELFFVKGYPIFASYLGYMAPKENEPPPLATRDDIEVERLRAAGAIIVGTTVAALGPRAGDPDPRLPRNPWDISRTTGGSSAGNGAAVAGGLLPLAIGDDGGGSIRLPSAFCGLVGLHPTRGRVPHVDYKVVAPRPNVGVGPMTRNVRDAAIAMQVLAGPDGRDFVCMQDTPPDYLAKLEAGVRGKRFAWTDNFGFASMPDAMQSLRATPTVYAATRALQKAGGRVTPTTMKWENPALSSIAQSQLTAGPNPPTPPKNPLSPEDMIAAVESRRRNWQRFQDVFAQNDFIVSPTVQFVAPKMDAWLEILKPKPDVDLKHAVTTDSVLAHATMCNILGLPAISIPAGFVERMPAALQVIGKPGSEAQLLQVAQAFLGTGASLVNQNF